MEIRFVILGTSPLLHHNPQMVDPNCEWNRAIKAITAKRKKTDEDLTEIERLEWFGGVYTGSVDGREVITQPTSKWRKCIINAAKITKNGKNVERAITMTGLDAALIYEGSHSWDNFEAELKRLQSSKVFNSRLSVGIGSGASKKRIMRVRPQFSPWALIMDGIFVEDAGLNFDELQSIIDLAGKAERLGDNRVNGYGGFWAHVLPLTGREPKIPHTIEGVRRFFEKLHAKEDAA